MMPAIFFRRKCKKKISAEIKHAGIGKQKMYRKTRRLNPLLTRVRILLRKNKEAKSSAPVGTVAFCFAKQGGSI
jgi:hypothetical protein